MTTDQLIGIAGIIATVVAGGAAYKYIIKKKNSGIKQKKGVNQIALQKSNQNTINIGGDTSQNEKGNNTK